ncbi:MAG: protocatechuate 3,4-dioxygenase subunit beta [Burkholderiales bacterium]|nr:MAG: protocatechuate 3,4-dioxygenase subunit beta [Burkholderiales bacterium]TAG77704.1 MAG: protocatechuate 3,4-dioxygenase subunit beta [Betaproteobacteria bacterium]
MRFPPLGLGERPNDIHPPYKSTSVRGPREPRIAVRHELVAATGIGAPISIFRANDTDLTRHGTSEPMGQAITVSGRVIDEDGKPVRDSLVEVWQCNAAGRYAHAKDDHDAPLDPNFLGQGKFLTDHEGRYRFKTIKPGAYPWGNHENAWRPAHIHFSLFGNVYAQRLVTQMYFPDDPLFPFDPIFNGIPDGAARQRLISRFSLDETVSGTSLGYVFDIVLRGRGATPTGI